MVLNRRSLVAAAFSLACLLLTSPAKAVIRDGGIDPANLGKGDWVYYLSALTSGLGGNVPSVTNIASYMAYEKSQGIRYIIVKAASGSTLYPSDASPQFTTSLVNSAHAAGLLIFGYNRSGQGGVNVAGEVAVADFVFSKGADGFVWDAESEWEVQNVPDNLNLAWQICSQTRSNWPNKFLAHAPFDIISYHSSFPYKEFGYWSDAVMPQIYHFARSNIKSRPSGNINWADSNWKSWQNGLVGQSSVINGQTIYWTNAIKPLAPVNHVYGPNPPNSGVSEIPPSHVMEFVDLLSCDPNTVTVGGYKGASFWRADLHGIAQWVNIKSATIGDFPGIVNNIVIDSPNATRVGAWASVRTFSNGTFYGDGSGTDTNSFGTNYLTKGQGTGAAYMQFTPTIVIPGDYDVYQWHPTVPAASAGVPHLINYNGGSTTVYANQLTNPGTWSSLGRFNFAAGTAGNIRVLDNFAEAGAVAIVDGIKLVFAGTPLPAPAAPSGLSATTASSSQINLSWTDNATNETAFVVARGITSGGSYTDIASVAANATSYTNIGLLSSTTYYYVVRATNSVGSSTNSGQASATTSAGTATAPSITTPPQNLTVVAGQNAAFTVAASGSATLSYQWRFNGGDIANATASNYTRTAAQTNHAGQYTVVVTNSAGSITSAPAVLTVNFSLVVNATAGGSVGVSPSQSSYSPGASVTLTVTSNANYAFTGWSGDASGTSNPLIVTMTNNKSVTANFVTTLSEIILDNTNAEVTFDGGWQTGTSSTDKYLADYRFVSTIAGGLSNVTFRPTIGTAGYYNVYIWYPQGSNRATNAPWTIVYSGGVLNFAVNQTANGGAWRLLASALPFQTGTNGYVLLSNDTGYSGKVVLADAVRFVLTAPIIIAPAITTQPQSMSVNQDDDATFTVTATGSPLNYQWRFGGTPIPGETASSYTRANVLPGDAGNYSVIVSNSAGSVTSSNAALTVNVPPAITCPPNVTVQCIGAVPAPNPAFVQSSSACGPVTNSFVRDESLTDGCVTTIARTYRATDACGLSSECDQTIIVQDTTPPTVTCPTNLNVASYAFIPAPDTNLVSAVDNCGGAIVIAFIGDVAATNAGVITVARTYRATDGCGNFANCNQIITASVIVAPEITAQPQSQSAKVDTNVTFTVTATGTPTPDFQWRFNGAPISGATLSSFTRVNVETNDAGNYSVTMTNLAGTLTSSNATLTVTLPILFQFQLIERLPDGRVHLVIGGEPGESIWLDRASNFVDWEALTNLVNTNGTMDFIDTGATNFERSFYRTRQ